jgi:1,4-dihydroxy-6-naphthoate synthase
VWFNERYGLPMPLGANVVRRDLDARFGPGSLARVAGLLHASIRHALTHREESLEYAARWSPLKDHASLNRYIDFYVNDLTLDCRPLGAKAVELMLGQPVDWLAP